MFHNFFNHVTTWKIYVLKLIKWGCLFHLLFISQSLNASIVIWPTNLVMEQNEKSVILRLENRGNQPVVLQMRIYQWTQVNGEEQLLPQQNVIGSPPMMTIASGSQQIVRIINKKPALANEELTYRLVLDEIPTQQKGQQGVNFQMRYSLPLFIYGAGLKHNVIDENVQNDLSWRFVNSKGNKWLEFNNQGNTHLHLSHIDMNQKTAGLLSTYVLPHSVIRLKVNNTLNEPSQLTMTINGQKSYTVKKR